MPDIMLSKLRKSYGRNEVIHGVDLTVRAGEFVVLLGPSGCGKSTLLRMVAGLEAVTSGEIIIGEAVVNRLEPRQRGCAMVFQNYALYPHMTVAENIGYALRVAGLAKSERVARVRAVADSLGLGDFLDRKPGQLSGGQRQRVAMGRAMIREPKVFLYDEPLSNLDARLRVAMRAEIRKLHQKLGTTTLFVTHDQVEAMTLADRIVIMNKGVIEQIGTPREVYALPASTYVAGFIGAPCLNLLRGDAVPSESLIRLPDGQTLVYDRRRWPSVLPGPIIAGFRAEAAHFVPSGEGLSLVFDFVEELGASRLVHGTVGDAVAAVLIADDRPMAMGERFAIRVAPTEVHLFDVRSGRRLEEEPPSTLVEARTEASRAVA